MAVNLQGSNKSILSTCGDLQSQPLYNVSVELPVDIPVYTGLWHVVSFLY